MPVEATDIAGLLVVRWPTHGDERGFFRQTYQIRELAEALGRTPVLRQGNHSHSVPGVLRGFHAEPWDKFVYVVRGFAMAVVADIRPDSPTFGEARTFLLGDPPGERVRLFIAEGLANSFCALGHEPVDYLYDVGDYWRPGLGKPAVAWDDPDLAVDWPLRDPIVSDADAKNPTLRELFPDHPRWRRPA
ncbi:MAG TPA: dTDP-4-dehydrorhamnose 3,5-epimerase family protein [Egibacteraceae bacterium]|nr:dTDP-4-dehydrorhamnose 3,5-epimerase family protein [Actinomycetota bacterium]HWB71463.1 dTDP-4-dehydrorhamnose 3,5-epimerase family protein [Egibacteraceae bacterium]